jgi:hypothetical protein
MSYHAEATISIGKYATQDLLNELHIPVCFKSDEYSYYFTCRDTKMICEFIEKWSESEYYWGGMDLAMRAGCLYQMLKHHFSDYLTEKLHDCPYRAGTKRKRYVYAACAEYRFVFC